MSEEAVTSPVPKAAPPRTRLIVIGTLLIGAISVLATLASLGNVDINYRQMRALEKIASHLDQEKCK